MKVEIICLIYLLSPLLIIFLFNRYKLVRQIGTVLIAYAIGVIMALFGVIPTGDAANAETMTSIQKWIQNI
ncbi:MAG: hypothetical protein GX292_03130, partial [Bacteroidales bacterium]|nr:hypothetical protein [Bacteroidales bacterium]